MLVKQEIAHLRWHAGASVSKERLAMTSFLEMPEWLLII